jgi:AcrR family transcriptional regulator
VSAAAEDTVDVRPTGAHATRQRILEVSHEAVRDVGIRRLTMRAVAERASLSRAALYRHFPDKAALVDAVLVRNGHLVRAELDRLLSGVERLDDKCVLAARFGLAPPRELLLLELHINDPEELARLLTSGSAPFLERATRFWEPHVRAAQDTGEARTDVDPAEAAEWIARCLYSLAATPTITFDRGDPAAVERHVRTFVVGALRP